MAKLKVNGTEHVLDIEPEMPLLWAIRDGIGLTGTKFGCGIASCGTCTVHVNGKAVRSCVTPVSAVEGQKITTIEGLAVALGAENSSKPNLAAVQRAWIDHQIPQCGYCQSGQIMQAASLLAYNADPSDAEIETAMNGNLCRCMAYVRIKKAVKLAVTNAAAKQEAQNA